MVSSTIKSVVLDFGILIQLAILAILPLLNGKLIQEVITSTSHKKSIVYNESEFFDKLQDWRHELYSNHDQTDRLINNLFRSRRIRETVEGSTDNMEEMNESSIEDSRDGYPLKVHWIPNDCNAMNIRFKKRKVIHEGKRNTVFKVIDRESEIFYAYKTFTNPDEYTAELAFLMVSNHPNIIRPICIRKDSKNNQSGLLLEFLDGASSLAFAKTASNDELVKMAAQVLSVLGYVHRLGFLHADIKPENIMMVNGEIKVFDFGLATQLPFSKKNRGTPSTMAPELVYDGYVGKGIDYWAFGSLIAIWNGSNQEITSSSKEERSRKSKNFVPLRYNKDNNEYKFGIIPKKLDQNLREIIYICLNPDPKKRNFSFRKLRFLKGLKYFNNINWNHIH